MFCFLERKVSFITAEGQLDICDERGVFSRWRSSHERAEMYGTMDTVASIHLEVGEVRQQSKQQARLQGVAKSWHFPWLAGSPLTLRHLGDVKLRLCCQDSNYSERASNYCPDHGTGGRRACLQSAGGCPSRGTSTTHSPSTRQNRTHESQ